MFGSFTFIIQALIMELIHRKFPLRILIVRCGELLNQTLISILVLDVTLKPWNL